LGFYGRNPDPFVHLVSELWPGLRHSPTITHTFIALLERKGLLLRNYTQVRYSYVLVWFVLFCSSHLLPIPSDYLEIGVELGVLFSSVVLFF
jgi:hypothetical protein